MLLHAQVGPESMKALHLRMEELLEQYTAKYGIGVSVGSNDYDPVTFPVIPPENIKKRISGRRKSRPHSGERRDLKSNT